MHHKSLSFVFFSLCVRVKHSIFHVSTIWRENMAGAACIFHWGNGWKIKLHRAFKNSWYASSKTINHFSLGLSKESVYCKTKNLEYIGARCHEVMAVQKSTHVLCHCSTVSVINSEKERKKDERTDGQADGQTDGQTNVWTGKQTRNGLLIIWSTF